MATATAAGTSPGLSPAQARSIGQSTAKINLWTGSVRSGKTVGSLIRWCTYVANPPKGGALVVSGKTFDTIYRNVATTNPAAPSHWLRKKYLLRAADVGLRNWHFTLDDNPYLDPEYVAWLKSTYVGLWYRRYILGHWCFAEGAVFDMFDEQQHVVDILPPITQWLCLAVDYGTTNPLDAVPLGLGVDSCLYAVAEWRWDSRLEGRQLTDAEYSRKLRDWLRTVKIPASSLRGPSPKYMVIDPSATSFKVQAWQDGWTVTDGVNAVADGIRLVSTLLALGRLKIHRSCKSLLDEIPGYSWSEAHAERGEDVPVKVDDHAVDALRYGIATTRAMWQQWIPVAA